MRLLAVLVVALAAFVYAPIGSAASTTLVINEVDYDQPSTDTAEFFELKNVRAGRSTSTPIGSRGSTALRRLRSLPHRRSPQRQPRRGRLLRRLREHRHGPELRFRHHSRHGSDPERRAGRAAPPDGDDRGRRAQLRRQHDRQHRGNRRGPDEGNATADEGLSRCADGSDTDQNSVDFLLRPISPGANELVPGHAAAEPGRYRHLRRRR